MSMKPRSELPKTEMRFCRTVTGTSTTFVSIPLLPTETIHTFKWYEMVIAPILSTDERSRYQTASKRCPLSPGILPTMAWGEALSDSTQRNSAISVEHREKMPLIKKSRDHKLATSTSPGQLILTIKDDEIDEKAKE